MALNEGYATAIDWDWGRFSPHEYAAALQRDHLLGDPEALFDLTGFATQQGSYAYIVAGSFTRYLIDRYGIDSFKEVFPDGHFFTAYGTSLASLVHDWEEFLRTIDVSSLPTETVETIFAQQSIFRKTCARVTAERNSKGVQAIRVKDFETAEGEFSASFDDAETAFALRGLLQSLLGLKKYPEVVRTYESLDRQSMFRFNPGVLFMLGDALWLQGNITRALSVYREVEAMNYSDWFSENASLRCEIVKEPRLNRALADYFHGSINDSDRVALLKDLQKFDDSRDAATYLLAEELLSKKHYAEAAYAFRSISPAFGDRVLVLGRLMNGAEAFYSAGQFEEAKSSFWEAQNYARSATKLKKIGEWIDRCDFVSANLN
jgi:TolA-binding protein